MERYPNFIKKYKINSDIDNDSEKENIEPPVYSVDYLSKEFFNENSQKVSIDLIDKDKSNSDIDSEPEQENIEPPVYSVDSLSKEFFNENLSKLRKRKVYFREFKINKEKERVNQSISSKEHIPIQNKRQVFKNYHIKLTDLHEEKVEEKLEEEKVEEKMLNRLIKSLMNYLYFKN